MVGTSTTSQRERRLSIAGLCAEAGPVNTRTLCRVSFKHSLKGHPNTDNACVVQPIVVCEIFIGQHNSGATTGIRAEGRKMVNGVPHLVKLVKARALICRFRGAALAYHP